MSQKIYRVKEYLGENGGKNNRVSLKNRRLWLKRCGKSGEWETILRELKLHTCHVSICRRSVGHWWRNRWHAQSRFVASDMVARITVLVEPHLYCPDFEKRQMTKRSKVKRLEAKRQRQPDTITKRSKEPKFLEDVVELAEYQINLGHEKGNKQKPV